ncbi:putative membrane protein YccC [Actinoplanes tereljensis]|uniref:FUSC family protein n=1 Tax=Paractinoplanes tereljensis TaxID=571912 RepID=A0A919NMR2_9ACTN|nr:FUSC family protein [Actinoplanes tereljensis]GIF20789.1 FUSC family protein [Actinoplanes tereljensis]
MAKLIMPEVRAAAKVRPVDAAWAFALRAGLAVAVPLVVLVAAGRPAWAGVATFGAFTALYARDEPYARRARVLTFAAVGLLACVFTGTLAALSPHPEAFGAAAVALTGGVATLLCGRFRVGPPGGLMFAFATAVTSAMPATPTDLWRHPLLCGGSAALAWLIAMAGVLVDRDAPMRLAVARALRAAAALNDTAPTFPTPNEATANSADRQQTPGGPAAEQPPPGTRRSDTPPSPAGLVARQQAAAAIERAWRAVPPDRPAEALLVARAETELSGIHGHSPEAAKALRALADAVARRGPAPIAEMRKAETDEVLGRRVYTLLLREPGARRPGPVWPAAARVALGALAAGAAAGLLAHVTGLGHPYWAALSAVAVLQADSMRLSLHKAMQRAAGTTIGLFLAGAAVALPGDHWTLVAAIAIAQVCAELLVVRNYGLAMLAITPLALLVGELGRPTPAADLIGDRLVQTLLGCALGLLAAAMVRNRAAVRHLNEAITAVTAATTALRRDPGGPSGEATRVARALLTLREAYAVATGEPGLAPDTTERVLATEREARQSLAKLNRPDANNQTDSPT